MKKIHLLLFFGLSIWVTTVAQVVDLGKPFTTQGILTIGHFSTPKPNIIWVAGAKGQNIYSGDIALSADNGRTWREVSITPPNPALSMTNMQVFDEKTAIATFYDGVRNNNGFIYRTQDTGRTWQSIKSAAMFTDAASFADFSYFTSPKEGFTLGDPTSGYYEIWRTEDSAKTWARVPQANIAAPLAGEALVINNFQAMGQHTWFCSTTGRVFRSNNLGKNWTVANTPFTVTSGSFVNTSICMSDTLKGFASRTESAIVQISKTTDGGRTFGAAFAPRLVAADSVKMTHLHAKNIPNTSFYLAVVEYTNRNGVKFINFASSKDDGNTWQLFYKQMSLYWSERESFLLTSPTTCYFLGTGAKAMRYEAGNLLDVKEDKSPIAALSIFPNPSSDFMQVQLPEDETATLLAYDVTGRLILEKTIQGQAKIETNNWASGVYTIIVQGKNAVYVGKFMKN